MDVFVADFAEDLLDLEWVQIFIQVLQAFLDVWIHIATVLKLFDQVVNFLIFRY